MQVYYLIYVWSARSYSEQYIIEQAIYNEIVYVDRTCMKVWM